MTDEEVTGSLRMLAARVLYEAVDLISTGRRGGRADRWVSVAEEWSAGKQGTITLEDCCEILGYNEDLVKSRIQLVRKKVYRKPAHKRDRHVERIRQFR